MTRHRSRQSDRPYLEQPHFDQLNRRHLNLNHRQSSDLPRSLYLTLRFLQRSSCCNLKKNGSCMIAQAQHQALNYIQRTLIWTTFFSLLLQSSCGHPSFQSGFSVLWHELIIVPYCRC